MLDAMYEVRCGFCAGPWFEALRENYPLFGTCSVSFVSGLHSSTVVRDSLLDMKGFEWTRRHVIPKRYQTGYGLPAQRFATSSP